MYILSKIFFNDSFIESSNKNYSNKRYDENEFISDNFNSNSIDLMKRLLEENNILFKKIEELSKNNNKIINNTYNNITIIAYNKTPDLSHLSNNDFLTIMQKGFNSVPRLIEAIYFNPVKPENHNVYIPNIKNNYVMVWNGSKWDLTSRDNIIDEMYDDNSNILIDKLEEFRNIKFKLKPSVLNKFKRFIEKKEEDEIKNKIKEEIKLVLYNKKNMITSK